MSIIRDIYFGVPKYIGELFRATKAPALLFLFCTFGVSLIASVGMTSYAFAKHSVLPFKIMAVGMIQHSIALDPNSATRLSPAVVRMFNELTPEQRKIATNVVNAMEVNGCVALGAIIWWAFRYRRFRATRKISRSRP